MGFTITKTTVKATDTIEKFEKKVQQAKLNEKKITMYLTELDQKEGVWGVENCTFIRNYLEKYTIEGGE